MLYLYVKALHIIFIVTWFAGLFYMPRFFIYNTEAGERTEVEKNILRVQFGIMMKRLWYGITWPSAILTLVFGGWMWYLLDSLPQWLLIKLCFVMVLYLYPFSGDRNVGRCQAKYKCSLGNCRFDLICHHPDECDKDLQIDQGKEN